MDIVLGKEYWSCIENTPGEGVSKEFSSLLISIFTWEKRTTKNIMGIMPGIQLVENLNNLFFYCQALETEILTPML
jgi:hypothetical protein